MASLDLLPEETLENARMILSERAIETPGGCLVWPTKSYGSIKIDGTWAYSHRWSYRVHKGEIGDKHVLHSCDNPPCCNPDHLRLGTPSDNAADRVSRGRSGPRRRRGKYTDELVEEVRAKCNRGFPVPWLVAEYGMSASYIREISRG